ncbi:MAG: hypothetical protein AAF982_06755, partial [Pseudomonadota bacterium]
MSRHRFGQSSPFRRDATRQGDRAGLDWLQDEAPKTRKRRLAPGDPIRLGMVGGGKEAFIGAVHRHASRLDGRYVLVAGALSSTPE